MPLTRHLYEIDEVVSALQLCLCNGWPRALFWIWELVVSHEEELATRTLTEMWLQRGGGHDPYMMTTISWPERYSRLVTAMQAAGSLRASRFLQMTATMPARPSVTPLPKDSKTAIRRKQRATAFVASVDASERADAEKFWISFDAACRQHSRRDAFWLLQAAQHQLSADAIWSALEIASRGPETTLAAIIHLRASATPHPVQQILYQSAAVLILCTPSAERDAMLSKPAGLKTKMYERDWDSWNAMVGRRQARLHAIPPEALHAETTRGQIPFKYTNISDVRDPLPLLSEGCAFWQEALKSYGITTDEESGATEFPDDTVLERFYDHYFPDDIPDEWSKQDQEKSHGRGGQEKSFVATSVQFREEPVEQRAWNCGIHVRQKR